MKIGFASFIFVLCSLNAIAQKNDTPLMPDDSGYFHHNGQSFTYKVLEDNPNHISKWMVKLNSGLIENFSLAFGVGYNPDVELLYRPDVKKELISGIGWQLGDTHELKGKGNDDVRELVYSDWCLFSEIIFWLRCKQEKDYDCVYATNHHGKYYSSDNDVPILTNHLSGISLGAEVNYGTSKSNLIMDIQDKDAQGNIITSQIHKVTYLPYRTLVFSFGRQWAYDKHFKYKVAGTNRTGNEMFTQIRTYLKVFASPYLDYMIQGPEGQEYNYCNTILSHFGACAGIDMSPFKYEIGYKPGRDFYLDIDFPIFTVFRSKAHAEL